MRIPVSTHILLSLVMLTARPSLADEIRVAVASNFTEAAKSIARHFEAATRHKVVLSFGSTGKHYAQIRNGAPFDVFLAADSRRPELLDQEGVAIPDSRFTYAVGKLVLWSPKAGYVDPAGKVLQHMKYRFLAVANPRLAPYGVAAREVLQARGLWDGYTGHRVRGENIGQTYQFVKSGNAELGFIAYSQIKQARPRLPGSFWIVPQKLYQPIKQQAVLLTDDKASRAFLSFMQSDDVLHIIHDYGYDIP